MIVIASDNGNGGNEYENDIDDSNKIYFTNVEDQRGKNPYTQS